MNCLMDDLVAAGVDSFHAIEPRAGKDIRQLKQTYGHALELTGNVDCSTVWVDGSVEAVQTETEADIRMAAPEGGFMLSTRNSVHLGVQPEYYVVMLEMARAVGNYPIH
jgi:uroporphyrinogen decarboxylase